MKAFIVVSLVYYLGAASAGLALPALKLEKTPAKCREQAYLETLNCTTIGLKNGTAVLECLAAVVMNYVECTEDSEPQLENELLPLQTYLIGKVKVDKFKCIVNNILDTLKCIVNDGPSQILKNLKSMLQTSMLFKDIE